MTGMLREISDQNSTVIAIAAQKLFPDGNANAFDYIESIDFIDLLFAGECGKEKMYCFISKFLFVVAQDIGDRDQQGRSWYGFVKVVTDSFAKCLFFVDTIAIPSAENDR